MKREVTITVPKDWSAVTLRKYLELKKDMDAYAGEPEAVLACMFHHLCNFPVEYIQGLDMNTYTAIVSDMTSFLADVELPLQKFIQIDGVEYGFEPNLSQMSYGAYVDISKYDSVEINEKWAEIMSILYRPVIKKTGKLYDIEPYKAQIDGEKFMDVTMDVHFSAIFFFQNFTKRLIEFYPEIFDQGDGDGNTTQHAINFSKKWKSYTSLIQLANGDVLKIDEITEQPLEKCLMKLAFDADKIELENLIHKEAMKKMG